MANLAHPAFQGTFEPEPGKDAEVEAGFREPGILILMMIQAKNDKMDTLAHMSIVPNNLKYILL